jgi:thiol:disulfide interchange protein DsbC
MPAQGAAPVATKVAQKQAAAALPAGPALEADVLKEKLNKSMPELALEKVSPSPIPGLFEVQRGSLFGYVTADGRYLISGDLVNLQTGEEITEVSRKQLRLDMLAKLGDQYIQFDPPGGKPQNVVTAFIDVDCGYCRKLHDDLPGYNALGISMRYVFFPRAGLGTSSSQQLDAVWCSADRKTALTRAVNGEKFASKACATPTQAHFETGMKLGVRGTPLLILPNGETINGYAPPDKLAQRIVASTLPTGPAAAAAVGAPKSAP